MNGERNEDVVEDSIPSGARNRPSGKRVSNVAARRAGRVEAAASSGAGTATLTRPRVRPHQSSQQPVAKQGKPPMRWIRQLFTFFEEVLSQLRKVIWPNRNQMVTYTTVVLVFLAVMVSLIGGLDFGFIKAVSWLFG